MWHNQGRTLVLLQGLLHYGIIGYWYDEIVEKIAVELIKTQTRGENANTTENYEKSKIMSHISWAT